MPTPKRARILISFLCSFFVSVIASGQCKTEAELVGRIMKCLQAKDPYCYSSLFPSADTIAQATLRKAPKGSPEYVGASMILETPILLLYKDSAMTAQCKEMFDTVMLKSDNLNIHWAETVLSRFELEEMQKTRDEVYEAIAPQRFLGFVFAEDMLTRKHYAFTLSDMMKIEGKWYGGELKYIFEAKSKDEFNAQLKAERIRIRKGLPADTSAKQDHVTTEEDEDSKETYPNKRKQVADRKLFTGMLDNEIPVLLYVRYIKGGCPEGICAWEAIFKFGDQDEYMKETVTRTEDGKWVFTEDQGGSVMELEFEKDMFTGMLTSTSDKTDYEVKLKLTPMSNKKMEDLDSIIEKGMAR